MATPITRTALVTGGLSGLGAAAARKLTQEGVRVFTVDISAGADFQLDVTDEEAVSSLPSQLPPIDILVTSAGIVGPNLPLLETTNQQWNQVFAVNFCYRKNYVC